MRLTFLKNERTLSKKSINSIYNSGNSIYSQSLKLMWINSISSNLKIQLLISVPKKNIKKAVDRNYVKRLIKEIYKRNKPFIYNLISSPIKIILIYNKTTLPEFNKLKIELLTLFEKLDKKQNVHN